MPIASLYAAMRGRIRGLFLRDALERELSDEIRFHIETETEKNIASGYAPDEARRLAMIAFGGTDRFREEHRDARGMRALRDIPADVRYAIRSLFKNKDFSAAVILTMMLGIGATAAVSSVAYGVLLRPLPYVDADRLVRLWSRNTGQQLERFSVSPADVAIWRERNQVFSAMGVFERQRTTTLLRGNEPIAVETSNVSPDIFTLLGTSPVLGRSLTTADADAGVAQVALISYELWTTQFGADSGIVNTEILLDGRKLFVIGVMPERFSVPGTPAQIWLPWSMPIETDRGNRYLRVLARVRPGVTTEAVAADMARIASQITAEFPADARGWDVNMMSIPDLVVGAEWRRAVAVLVGVALFVLLIACANAANLQLARGASRRQELALRATFGARRGRIVRQLLSESAVLAIVGGAGGLALAYAGVTMLKSIGADTVPRMDEVEINGAVLAFVGVVTMASAFLFGLMPALGASRADLTDALNGPRGALSALMGKRARATLVVTQMALSLVLLVGTGLLLRSFMQLQRVELGFDERGLYVANIRLPEDRYTQAPRIGEFYLSLLEHARSAPASSQAALVSNAPFAGPNTGTQFTLPERPSQSGEQPPGADYRVVSDHYFRTAAIDMIRGRDFSPSDRTGAPDVLIISEAAAEAYWPGQNPVGRQVQMGSATDPVLFTIVGVVRNARYLGVDDTDSRPMIYFSVYARPQRGMSLVVRADAPAPVSTHLREGLRRGDPLLPAPELRSVETLVDRELSTQRFALVLFGTFAGIALLLAALGIYGVIAYVVRQRTRELGIRTALGATATTLIRDVVGSAMRLAAIGVTIGLVGSWLLTDLIETLLFGVGPRDLTTFAAVSLLLCATALLASIVPAVRAARVDPMVALRAE